MFAHNFVQIFEVLFLVRVTEALEDDVERLKRECILVTNNNIMYSTY
jgi:hypothetical protein